VRDALVRRERLAHAMREVLSELLLTQVKDPRLAGVVISAVELSGDMKLARAFFSVFGDDERVRQVADGLVQARGFLRHESAKRMRMHNPPDLEFKRDLGFERADRIARVLDEIAANRPETDENEAGGQEPETGVRDSELGARDDESATDGAVKGGEPRRGNGDE
jgi:ribosome-binding factor A